MRPNGGIDIGGILHYNSFICPESGIDRIQFGGYNDGGTTANIGDIRVRAYRSSTLVYDRITNLNAMFGAGAGFTNVIWNGFQANDQVYLYLTESSGGAYVPLDTSASLNTVSIFHVERLYNY